jgi:hypothetical protein
MLNSQEYSRLYRSYNSVVILKPRKLGRAGRLGGMKHT